MRNKKKRKNINDYSVSKLLDDFLSPDAPDITSSTKGFDDEEYIRMMLQKDEARQRERRKRKRQGAQRGATPRSQSDTIDDDLRQRFFPDMDEAPIEKTTPQVEKGTLPKSRKIPPKQKVVPPDNEIIEEIMGSIVVKDVTGLAARMKEAVDFVQEEMGTSDAELKLIEALERYKKPDRTPIKRVSNDNILVLKRCQNCYYCVGERNSNGSTWCLCNNLDRATDVEIKDSWVKSENNLACWKAPQD